jgi:hypothetical protein
MTTDTREPTPRYKRYRLAYSSGTVVQAYYCGGATLREVAVLHPMARVEAVEDLRVIAEVDRP